MVVDQSYSGEQFTDEENKNILDAYSLTVDTDIARGQTDEGDVSFELLTFDGDAEGQGIPFALGDYLELVDWSGRAIRSDKRGYIPE